MTWLAFSVLSVSILFLLAAGGGIFAWTVCVIAVVTAAGLWILARRRQANPQRFGTVEAVYLAVLGFLLLTLLPLPTALTRVTGTVRHAQNRNVQQATAEAADLDLLPGPVHTFAMTRNRAGSLRALALIVAAFSALGLAAFLPRRQRAVFAFALVLLGGLLGIAGVLALRVVPQGDTLWWVVPIPHGLPGPVLCFVNRNHYAGYLAMLCPPALGLVFTHAARRRPVRTLLPLAAFVMMTTALVLTRSRGAVVAYAAGHLALLALYLARRRWVPALVLACAGATVIASLTAFAGPTFRARMASLRQPLATGNFDERLDAWKTCGRIWSTYPVAGAGANAFRMVFPQHRTTSRREYMLHAENEYLQMAAEGGTVGILLFMLCLAAVWHHRRRPPFSDGPDSPPSEDLLDTALWAALIVAAVHSAFDFAPRLPAYAVTAASLAGLLLRSPDRGLPRPTQGLLGKLPTAWPLAAGLAVAILLLPQAVRMGRLDRPAEMPSMRRPELARALQWAPSSWQAWFYFGRACCNDTPRPAHRLGERCVTRAARLDPNNYLLWRELGHLRRRLGMTEEARAAYARAKELRYWLDVPDV